MFLAVGCSGQSTDITENNTQAEQTSESKETDKEMTKTPEVEQTDRSAEDSDEDLELVMVINIYEKRSIG